MAIDATYIILQQQVADEMGDRTDLLTPLSDSGLLSSPVKNAIQSAIAKWEREPFYFNEAYSSPLFTTVAGQEFYMGSTADPSDVQAVAIATTPNVLWLHILIANNRFDLEKREWQYIEDISINPDNRGQPMDWAYFANQIRLYPIPDGAYPVRASRTTKLTNLVNDADTNVWTTDAFDLIKAEAKLILAREVTHDPALAQECEMAIYGNPSLPASRGYLGALKAETTRRARSKIKASQF